MPSFAAFEAAAPELAARVRERLDAHVHKTLATLRHDGAPRVSGIGSHWVGEELLLGSMPRGRKVDDLRRDARFALHSGSDDPPAWTADCKLSGVAVEVVEAAERAAIDAAGQETGASAWFRLDLREVSVVALTRGDGRDTIRVDVWTPEDGVRTLWPES